MAKPRKSRRKKQTLSWLDLIRVTQFRDDALGTDLMRNNALLRHLNRQESVDHIPIGYNPGWTEL